jgi:peptidoglycan/xylan/chitin deacetylase (PgdA/CDA1 family)/GT2 family glycosyltransferase
MAPEITVVVPSFNRCGPLSRLLDGLESQNLEPELFEVIVVLDGSTDGSEAMLAARKPPFALTVFTQKNAGPGAARNKAVEAARAPFCLFVDDDMVASKELVGTHLALQREHGGAIVVGGIKTHATRRGFPHYAMEFWDRYNRRRERGLPLVASDCYTGNMSAPTAALRKAGGFDTTLGRAEDVEIAARLLRLGLEAVYAPAACATQIYTKSTADILADDEKSGFVRPGLWRRDRQAFSLQRLEGLASRDAALVEVARLAVRLQLPRPVANAIGLMPVVRPTRKLFGAMRAHAFLRGAAIAGRNGDWDAMSTGVRILNYHAFATGTERSSRWIVTADELRQQMGWLRRSGAEVLSLRQYAELREAGALFRRFTVVVTVDDGYADALTVANPIYAEFGIPWTLFAPAAGEASNSWDRTGPLAGRRLLTAAETGTLAANGCEIGSHGMEHVDWRNLPEERTRAMAQRSKCRLEAITGKPVTSFAYPYGGYDEAARAAVQAAGYRAACTAGHTSGAGADSDPLALPRIEVPGGLSLRQFRSVMLTGRAFRKVPLL